MRDDDARCGSCAFWREGAPAFATQPAPEDGTSDYGACEYGMPRTHVGAGGVVVTFQPVTHRSRACTFWAGWSDDPDDGGREDIPGDADGPRPAGRRTYPLELVKDVA